MNDDPLLKDFAFKVSEEIRFATEFLADGRCSTIEQYKQKTGFINGLRKSLEIMTDSAKTYLSDDNEDD